MVLYVTGLPLISLREEEARPLELGAAATSVETDARAKVTRLILPLVGDVGEVAGDTAEVPTVSPRLRPPRPSTALLVAPLESFPAFRESTEVMVPPT